MSFDTVGGYEESVAFADRKNGGRKRRQLLADNSAPEEKHFRKIRPAGDDPRERSHNIADAEPGHHSVIEINRSSAENDATRGLQRAMTFLHERDNLLIAPI